MVFCRAYQAPGNKKYSAFGGAAWTHVFFYGVLMAIASWCKWILVRSAMMALLVTALLLTGNLASAADGSALHGSEGFTQVSRDVYDLHIVALWVCVAIGVVVFAAMLVSMVMHRKSPYVGISSYGKSTRLEWVWTVVPIAILLMLAVPATSRLRSMYAAIDSDVDIRIVGHQWQWQYTYLDDNPASQIRFMSIRLAPRIDTENQKNMATEDLPQVDKPMVVPINKRIRLLITSEDVSHTWWVPDFAVKKEAVPGFVQEAWIVIEEPGIYRGRCLGHCDQRDELMPIVVQAVTQSDYESWLAENRQDKR